MDITANFERDYSAEHRIVQAILDSIAAEQTYPDPTEAQTRELDRRIADSEINPDSVLTWQEVKASLQNQ